MKYFIQVTWKDGVISRAEITEGSFNYWKGNENGHRFSYMWYLNTPNGGSFSFLGGDARAVYTYTEEDGRINNRDLTN